MQLDIRGDTKIDNPGSADIADAVNSLDGGENSFVILDTDTGFIQASCNEYGQCDLEYTLHVGEDCLRCKNDSLSKPLIIDAFVKFARQDYGWMEQYEWEANKHIENQPKKGIGCAGVLLAVLVGALALAVIFWNN